MRMVENISRSIGTVMTTVAPPGAFTRVGEEQHVDKDHAEDRVERDPHR
jgi:hypothetical protein